MQIFPTWAKLCHDLSCLEQESVISKSYRLSRPVQFGQIDFVNCLPITLPLLESLPEGMTLTMGTPGQLNRLYGEGKLDIGAMSAIICLPVGDFEVIPTTLRFPVSRK